jgi:3'(2'), 5'-bisphosphate nucleotidase
MPAAIACRSGMDARGYSPRPVSSPTGIPRDGASAEAGWAAEWRPAIEAVSTASRAAVRFAERLRAEPGGQVAKADASPVTAADLALQALLVLLLTERYGPIAAVGEESTAVFAGDPGLREIVHELVRSERPGLAARAIDDAIDAAGGQGTERRFWVMDPIDGTRGYLRGLQYCTCLALVDDGVPVFGAVGCPRLGAAGRIIAAARGQGAREWEGLDLAGRPAPLRVRDRGTDADPVRACASPEIGPRSRARLESLAVGLRPPPARLEIEAMESQVKFALVARGEVDLAVRFPFGEPARDRDMIWDYAGAVTFVEEAGGRMTDCRGEPLRFGRGRSIERNAGILCTAGWAWRPAVERLAAADPVLSGPRG